jgi:hypothetical protein
MSETIERAPAGAHLLQLYENVDGLAQAVTQFMGDALRRGEAAILIATPEHGRAFQQGLTASGFDLAALTATGRFTLIDAHQVLPELIVDGMPDADRFETLVATRVQAAQAVAPAGRVSAYGELVDVLWQSGRLNAALHLEDLWRGLMSRMSMTLMCGYALHLLSPDLDDQALLRTCEVHSHALLAHDRTRLERSVDRAMEGVLGDSVTDSLRPLIRATLNARGPLGGAERTVLWLRRNLPHLCDAVLAEARRLYAESA